MRAEYDFSGGERKALIPQKGKTRISIFIDNATLDDFRQRAESAGTGYQTMIAMRYQGKAPGDVVTLAQARASRRASGCWAGSAGDKVAMTIGVRQVQVPGNGGRVDGTIAWAKVTQGYLFPMDRAPGGVLGTQDVIGCGPA